MNTFLDGIGILMIVALAGFVVLLLAYAFMPKKWW